MSIRHHPDDATLFSYAAGSLPESFDIVLACHLKQCEHCRNRTAQAELLGGMLLEEIEPVPLSGRQGMAERLDDERPEPDAAGAAQDQPLPDVSADSRLQQLPPLILQLLEKGDHALGWKWLVPGIQQIVLPTHDGGLRLMKIAPGTAIPLHSHQGSELTLVIEGAYRDEQGYFQPGDLSDPDPDTEHQPIAEGDTPCICLFASDGPLRFSGLLPRMLQPLIGI